MEATSTLEQSPNLPPFIVRCQSVCFEQNQQRWVYLSRLLPFSRRFSCARKVKYEVHDTERVQDGRHRKQCDRSCWILESYFNQQLKRQKRESHTIQASHKTYSLGHIVVDLLSPMVIQGTRMPNNPNNKASFRDDIDTMPATPKHK